MLRIIALALVIAAGVLLWPTFEHTYDCSVGHPGFKNLVACFNGRLTVDSQKK
jgi:hypothetical protein